MDTIYLHMAVKKTALLLDTALVERCRELLGTKSTTDTIHEALREVVRVQGRARHFERLRQREVSGAADAPR